MSKNSLDDDSRVMLLPFPEGSSSPGGLPPPRGLRHRRLRQWGRRSLGQGASMDPDLF